MDEIIAVGTLQQVVLEIHPTSPSRNKHSKSLQKRRESAPNLSASSSARLTQITLSDLLRIPRHQQ